MSHKIVLYTDIVRDSDPISWPVYSTKQSVFPIPSEYWTSLVFKWLKRGGVVQYLNNIWIKDKWMPCTVPVFKWYIGQSTSTANLWILNHLQSLLQKVWYSNVSEIQMVSICTSKLWPLIPFRPFCSIIEIKGTLINDVMHRSSFLTQVYKISGAWLSGSGGCQKSPNLCAVLLYYP